LPRSPPNPAVYYTGKQLHSKKAEQQLNHSHNQPTTVRSEQQHFWPLRPVALLLLLLLQQPHPCCKTSQRGYCPSWKRQQLQQEHGATLQTKPLHSADPLCTPSAAAAAHSHTPSQAVQLLEHPTAAKGMIIASPASQQKPQP
jgi:hypothetical protein